MQIRTYTSVFTITETNINITTTFPGGTQHVTNVTRDGSMDTNFKAACAADRDTVLSLAASSTSPPCYVSVRDKWIKIYTGATVTTDAAIVKVPTGNSGKVKVYFEFTDTGTMERKIAAGSWTAITDGTEIILTDGQTLTFRGLTMAHQEFVNGTVVDSDTGVSLDAISLMNSTPV